MNVCKFCGAKCTESVLRDYVSAYHCGSWHDGAGQWSQGIACRNRCEQIRVQLEGTIQTLRKRIAKAIEAANQANRFGIVTEHGITTARPSSAGCYAWASVLDDIASILTGNNPEKQEGST